MHLILLAKYWQYIVIAVLSLIIVFMTFMLRDASNTMQLLQACQTHSVKSQPKPLPTLIFNETPLPSQATHSKRAAQDIASWRQQLIDLQIAYEQRLKQIDNNQTTLP